MAEIISAQLECPGRDEPRVHGPDRDALGLMLNQFRRWPWIASNFNDGSIISAFRSASSNTSPYPSLHPASGWLPSALNSRRPLVHINHPQLTQILEPEHAHA